MGAAAITPDPKCRELLVQRGSGRLGRREGRDGLVQGRCRPHSVFMKPDEIPPGAHLPPTEPGPDRAFCAGPPVDVTLSFLELDKATR